VLSDPRFSTVVTTAVVIVVVVTFAALAEAGAGVGSWWIAAGVLVCVAGLVIWIVDRAKS
jgi:hypothetical protein